MKKKFLVALMTMLMLIGITGCGNADDYDSLPTPTPKPTKEAMPTPKPTATSTPGPTEEAMPTPGDEDGALSDDASNDGETEVSKVYFATDDSVMYYNERTVYSLDVNTGETNVVSHFKVPTSQYSFSSTAGLELGMFYEKLRFSYFYYSADFSKRAATLELPSGETHAGWVDSTGTFFDVNKALNEVSNSEFDPPKHYVFFGFIDNYYEYYDADSKKFYYVDIDQPNVKYAGNPIGDKFESVFNSKMTTFSDLLDDTHALGDHIDYWTRVCRGGIFASDETFEFFFPEDSPRWSWGFVCSPDKESVAFISSLKWYEDCAFYYMSLEDRVPIRIKSVIDVNGIAYGHDTIMMLKWQ